MVKKLQAVPEYRTDAVKRLRDIADELEASGDVHTICVVACRENGHIQSHSVGRDADRPALIVGALELAKMQVYTVERGDD